MLIKIRQDSVTVEGYVNAVERNSKPLNERGVTFIERIASGAFKRAIARAKDIRILLNHNWDRNLGGTAEGNLELEEDAIGLKARATITDPEVIEDARHGDLVGWSFGFRDEDVKQLRDEESGLPLRKVNDLELYEVSLLNRSKSPAYVGTLVNVRSTENGDDLVVNLSEDNLEENVETIDEAAAGNGNNGNNGETTRDEGNDEDSTAKADEKKEVSSEYFARYKNIIAELKSLVKQD